MGEQSEKIKKNICMGLLAHVDAGKTTLSEALLYLSGKIRKLGRVDHKDAYLDTSPLERERGITIFSKQAVLEFPETRVTILDTPGHVDFSAEMERTLQVLDYAVLLINGADGVQGHTVTLWKLLERYQIPTFIFVNKMDQDGTDHDALLTELKKRLNENCMDFSENENADGDLEPELPAGEKEQQNLMENKFSEEFLESLAMCDEKLLEKYLETGEVSRGEITGLIADRKVFPCYFGSALRMEGVEKLIHGLDRYTRCPVYPEAFGAKVYKIARDDQGNRLSYMKVTGGTLKVKELLITSKGNVAAGEEVWEEKADQIRIYERSARGNRVRSDRSFPYFSRTGTWRDREFQYASTGAGTELSDHFAGRLRCAPDAEEAERTGRGRSSASYCMGRAAGRNPRHAHGRRADRDPEKADLGAVPCGCGFWNGKYCI